MLEELAEEYWQGRLEACPITSTALGERARDHLMGDATPAGMAADAARLRGQLERVRALRPEGLTAAERVTRGELLGAIERDLDHLESGTEQWMVSHFMGPSSFLMSIPDMQALRTPDETAAYTARLGDMARWVDEVCANLQRGRAAGKFGPRRPVERALGQAEHLLEQETSAWSLAQHYDTAPEATREAERAAGTGALEAGLRPALERYRDLLRQLLPLSRGDDRPGMMHVEGGAAAYARLARAHTSLDLGPEEIHAIGMAEVERIRGEFSRLGKELLGTEDLPTIQETLRNDPRFRYQTAAEIEEVARDAVRRAEAALEGRFGLKPTSECVVRPIADHEAPSATLAYYRQPSPDGSRPGTYYINTYQPTTRPRYEAEVLAFHEAVPGHHLQIDIAQRLEELPAFRRHGGVTAYVEGWALYTEVLSEEMDLYTGCVDRIGARSFDAWRACRLVVDTGLHALGWSRDRAIEFMVANTLLTPDNVANEVDRYMIMPGQALSYKLGQLEILRLRQHAREAMGARFRLADFHDRVLEMGAVSLGVLGERIEEWAANGAPAGGPG